MAARAGSFEEIQESELSGENGEVYLFPWLSSTEKLLEGISPADLKPKQSDLKKVLVKSISASDSYPPPGRAIRNVVGRCLVTLYTRGETRTMFDTMQAFLGL